MLWKLRGELHQRSESLFFGEGHEWFATDAELGAAQRETKQWLDRVDELIAELTE